MEKTDIYIQKLGQMIKSAERVLITSHTSPDPDAVASVLLLGTTLGLNYPDKSTVMALEEEPDGLTFLADYNLIQFGPLRGAIEKTGPDLVIMVDVSNLTRTSRKDGDVIKKYLIDSGAKLVIIDHHIPQGQDQAELCINSTLPAAAAEVYDVLFKRLNFRQPESSAQTTMVGLYADTGGFIYINDDNTDCFKLAAELVETGVSIEEIKYKLGQLSQDQMKAIGELCLNVSETNGFTYSFLSDEYVDAWHNSGKDIALLQKAHKTFVDNYLRIVGGHNKGFSFYKNHLDGENTYSVSLRSIRYSEDVMAIAQKIDGGGHKSAAGGKVIAGSIDEALAKIKQVLG